MSKKKRKIEKYSLPLYTKVDKKGVVKTPFLIFKGPVFSPKLKKNVVEMLWHWNN